VFAFSGRHRRFKKFQRFFDQWLLDHQRRRDSNRAASTAEQQQAIKDVIAQVQKAMTDSANKAGQDLKKSLPSK